MKKMEITRELERMRDSRSAIGSRNLLDESIAILNLPAPYYCSKGCAGCVTKDERSIMGERRERLPLSEIKRIIGFFSENYGTRFITINGRGDPFHIKVKSETLEKIAYARSLGIRSFVFTAGDALDGPVCRFLADHQANVMISLFGNRFIDAGFFGNGGYDDADAAIAENLRILLRAYRDSPEQPEEGTTRLGMNYVVSEDDVHDPARLMGLKAAANENGIFFICNTNFVPHPDLKLRESIGRLAKDASDFNMSHSTHVDGICQMGAGSSVTVAANGEIYRCPYMLEGGEGRITQMLTERLKEILTGHMKDRRYKCVMRQTPSDK